MDALPLGFEWKCSELRLRRAPLAFGLGAAEGGAERQRAALLPEGRLSSVAQAVVACPQLAARARLVAHPGARLPGYGWL